MYGFEYCSQLPSPTLGSGPRRGWTERGERHSRRRSVFRFSVSSALVPQTVPRHLDGAGSSRVLRPCSKWNQFVGLSSVRSRSGSTIVVQCQMNVVPKGIPPWIVGIRFSNSQISGSVVTSLFLSICDLIAEPETALQQYLGTKPLSASQSLERSGGSQVALAAEPLRVFRVPVSARAKRLPNHLSSDLYTGATYYGVPLQAPLRDRIVVDSS